MKEKIVLMGLFFIITRSTAQTTTFSLSPAQQLPASQLYTNENASITVAETILCGCTPQVPATHLGNNWFSLAYTFQPGYVYNIVINGSATATGNLANPARSNINLGLSVGGAGTSSYFTQTCTPFPNYTALINFSNEETYNNALGFNCTAHIDLTNPFLTSILEIGTFPNSSTPSTISISPFIVQSTATGLNIESYPVQGDEPQTQDVTSVEDLINITFILPVPTTSTNLTINNVQITQAPNITSTPQINGATSVVFSASKTYSSGIITAPPGSLVTLTVSAFGGKPNRATVFTNCTLTTPGMAFATGSASVSATNGTGLTGTTTTTFNMPATGFVNWSGNISASNVDGSGVVTVH